MADNDHTQADCIFCGIVVGTIPSAKVHEDETTLAFMDIDPGSDGHLLVIPKRHSADLLSVPESDLVATTLAARKIAGAVAEAYGADGVNLLNCCGTVAWQTVFHFHLHVIPRYVDKVAHNDRLELPYEPGHPADAAALTERARSLSEVLGQRSS